MTEPLGDGWWPCPTCAGSGGSNAGPLDDPTLTAERLYEAFVSVEMEDERLGVVGRGTFIERLAAELGLAGKP